MPVWTLYLLNLLSYVIIGATLGWLYKTMKSINLFAVLKNPKIQQAMWIFGSIAILYPIWGFLFGFLGSNIGLNPSAEAPLWIISIGIGMAVGAYALIAKE